MNSSCPHGPGKVLVVWVQRTLEKRQLSLPSPQCQPGAGLRAPGEGPLGIGAQGAEEGALRIGVCKLRVVGQGWL